MPMNRRELLHTMGSGFGLLGLAEILQATSQGSGRLPTARAKHVIYLFLAGGPSQVDTFDPKPTLTRYNGQPLSTGSVTTERKTGNLLASPFEFRRCGQSGIEVSEIFPLLGEQIDDICVIRSMHTERPNHEPSLLRMNCGFSLPGRPSMGSWITYGLGSENENLPAFMVLSARHPVVGPPLWASGFLPATYQGTHIRMDQTDPEKLIPHIRGDKTSPLEQRSQLDLLEKHNRLHLKRVGGDPELEGRIQAMEVAFRMQTEAVDAFDVEQESVAVRERYGPGHFARGCLMARRLVERGVRMVQVYFTDESNNSSWDDHDDILNHRKLAFRADRPIAALLEDLKASGLFEETVVLVGGEFGRTPVTEVSARTLAHNGRDHNHFGFSVLLAGGGVKGGMTYGATDDFGFKAVENPVDVPDLHATILHLLGLDHERLTYRYSGRDFRLTDVSGRVIQDILA